MSQSPLRESTSQEGERVYLHSALYYLADKLIHYLPPRKKKEVIKSGYDIKKIE